MTQRRFHSKLFFAAAGLAICAILIYLGSRMMAGLLLADAFFSDAQNWDPESEPWITAEMASYNDLGQLTLSLRKAHPFLAEYDRKIQVTLDGQDPIEVAMPINTGGATLINVYLMSAPSIEDVEPHRFLLLEDRLGKYIIKPVACEGLDFDYANYSQQYLGRFDGRNSPLEFVPFTDGDEEDIEITSSQVHTLLCLP